jgi:hypothetical protein
MKGQLFVVATIFLVGLMSTAQLLLSVYSSIDMPAAFNDRTYSLVQNVRENVERIISLTPGDCGLLEEELDDYRHMLVYSAAREAYSINLQFNLTCPDTVSYWISISKEGEEYTFTKV